MADGNGHYDALEREMVFAAGEGGGGGGGFGVRASVNSSSLLERDKNIELDTSAAIVAVLKRFVKR